MSRRAWSIAAAGTVWLLLDGFLRPVAWVAGRLRKKDSRRPLHMP